MKRPIDPASHNVATFLARHEPQPDLAEEAGIDLDLMQQRTLKLAAMAQRRSILSMVASLVQGHCWWTKTRDLPSRHHDIRR
jgi:hypothetical protein